MLYTRAVSDAVRKVHCELLANGSTEFSLEVESLVWQHVRWTRLTVTTQGGEAVFSSERTASNAEHGKVYIVENLSKLRYSMCGVCMHVCMCACV